MASYQDFTSARTTDPDPVVLLTALRAIDASIGYLKLSPQAYRLKKATPWAAGDISAAQNAIDTTAAITPQRQAQNEIDAWPISLKALVLALIDEINVLRTEINTLRAAVSPPLTPPLAARTPGQALTAIRNKAGTL